MCSAWGILSFSVVIIIRLGFMGVESEFVAMSASVLIYVC